MIPQLHLFIKVCGALFLLYLAWNIAMSRKTPIANKKIPGFGRAFFFQWINPKGVPVAFSIIATYTAPGDTFFIDIAVLMVISALMTLSSTSIWAFAGVSISSFLKSPRSLAVFNGVMGLLLALSVIPVFF